MAVIMRIEVVNYLSEGWQPSLGVAKWKPLWPANTLNLCGQSTAIQLPNGSGKTSITNGVLFLLSRDRYLKKEFLDRCAPVETGYTHLRIEFAMRGDDDLLQRDLITADPAQCPAKTYVIGVCSNRGDDDMMFYRYPGMLEDAPAYRSVDKTFIFTPNDVFRNSIKKLPKSDWNRWHSVAEWTRAVGEFVPPEVVRQNVSFHRRGAGDASATFEKFAPEPGERFDEAFFKQVVAPQLLMDVMGESAQEDERTVEDTITISMTRFLDAKLSVERKEGYIAKRAELEAEFEPVVAAANGIHRAEGEYQRQLQQLGRDASFLQRFAGRGMSAMPGVPRDITVLRLSEGVKPVVEKMAVDSDGTLLIADSGLAALLGMATGNLNLVAGRNSSARSHVLPATPSSQVIDLYCNIKILEGAGGRHKAVRYYDEGGAQELVRRSDGADTSGQVLTLAFEIARRDVDTNIFRHQQRRLADKTSELTREIEQADEKGRAAEAARLSLEKQITQRAENHAAYQEFCEQSDLLPEGLKNEPAEVERWLADEGNGRDKLLQEHSKRVGELTRDWEQWRLIRAGLGLVTMQDQLVELNAQQERLAEDESAAKGDKARAEKESESLAESSRQTDLRLGDARRLLASLGEGAEYDRNFRRIFGDVAATSIKPPIQELQVLQASARNKSADLGPKRSTLAELHALAPFVAEFNALFGDVDPSSCNPRFDKEKIEQKQREFENIYSVHVPYVEALDSHLEKHGAQPQQWLTESDLAHSAANLLVTEKRRLIADAQREIASLDRLKLVDDVEIEKAQAALETAKTPFKTVRALVLEAESEPARRLALLAAFGSMLGAPVVADFATAELAMAVIASAGINVPILLGEPLLTTSRTAFVNDSSGSASVGFLAGLKTRRIRAIVDPRALADERASWVSKLEQAESQLGEAVKRAGVTSTQTDDYRTALRAREGLRLGSAVKVAAAEQGMREIAPALKSIERLTTDAALLALSKATEYVRRGGDPRAAELQRQINELEAEIRTVDSEIELMIPKTTREAIVAHDGAVKFELAGGSVRVESVFQEEARLASLSIELSGLFRAQAKKLATATARLAEVVGQQKRFGPEYFGQIQRLGESIAFEAGGGVAFMRDKDESERKLVENIKALDPLRRVNLARAQSYKDLKGDDETSLHRKIGEAAQNREQAANASRKARKAREEVEALLNLAKRSAQSLHELALSLVNRLRSVEPFLADLVAREAGASPAEAHETYERAEDLRHRLRDWRPDQGPFDGALMASLRFEVEEIDIVATGAKTKEAQEVVARARDNFKTSREAFCHRARHVQAGAMAEAEIDAIETANTVEELRELAKLGDRLRADLATERENFEELQLSAQTVESESISILSKLVDSCRSNFQTMNSVMSRNPNARFFLDAKILGEDDIRKLLVTLRDGIEARKRAAQSSHVFSRREKAEASIRADVRTALIDSIFVEPSVQFRHIGMWGGDTRPVQSTLSEGQKAALQMMWLIKESEYHLECTVRKHLGGGSRKKFRDRSQRIMFFDGLFSNLSDRTLIDEAFKGLGDLGSNLQLVGLIHNDNYRNNERIFPAYLIGRRAGWRNVEGERAFIQFEDGRPEGSIGFATIIVKPPAPPLRQSDLHG